MIIFGLDRFIPRWIGFIVNLLMTEKLYSWQKITLIVRNVRKIQGSLTSSSNSSESGSSTFSEKRHRLHHQ